MQATRSSTTWLTTADRLAHGLSVLGNPFFLAALILVQLAAYSHSHPTVLPCALVSLLLFAVLPARFVYAAFRSGRVRDLELAQRTERLAPAVVAALCACAGRLALTELAGPPAFL